MTDHPTHGGKRPGAGRKPTLRPLQVVRLLDPAVRVALAELTAYERLATNNPALGQEQLVARLIVDAHRAVLPKPVALPLDSLDTQNPVVAARFTHGGKVHLIGGAGRALCGMRYPPNDPAEWLREDQATKAAITCVRCRALDPRR